MSLSTHPAESCEPRNHHVQFCADRPLLARNVAGFLKEGLRLDEALIVVAAEERRSAFAEALREEGENVEALTAQGRLTMLDARDTLARFMTGSGPDWTLFDGSVGLLVRRMRERFKGLRAYGEMVDLLWQEGKREWAIRLEELWNRLLQRVDFMLHCNYSLDLLDENVRLEDVETILSRHSEMHSCRSTPDLERAVDQALAEVLGLPVVDALRPLIRGTQYPRPMVSGPKAALLWARRHLPAHAGEILARARSNYGRAVTSGL